MLKSKIDITMCCNTIHTLVFIIQLTKINFKAITKLVVATVMTMTLSFVGDMDEDEKDLHVVNIFLLRFVTFSTPHLHPPHLPQFNRISTSWLCDSQLKHKKYGFLASRQLPILEKKFVAVTAKRPPKFMNSAKKLR